MKQIIAATVVNIFGSLHIILLFIPLLPSFNEKGLGRQFGISESYRGKGRFLIKII